MDRPETFELERLSRNLSNPERAVRLALGAALLAPPLAGWVEGHAALAFSLFAWVPIVTGLAGWCPVWQLFGISSRKR